MNSSDRLIAINFMVVFVFLSILVICLVGRDRRIHTAAFENGYEQVQRESSVYLMWQEVDKPTKENSE